MHDFGFFTMGKIGNGKIGRQRFCIFVYMAWHRFGPICSHVGAATADNARQRFDVGAETAGSNTEIVVSRTPMGVEVMTDRRQRFEFAAGMVFRGGRPKTRWKRVQNLAQT